MFFRIAFRNIFRQKRRTLLTAMTMFGGFTLSSISIAWQDGSYTYIIDQFTRMRLGHIQIHDSAYRDRPSLYKTIPDAETIGRQIEGFDRLESWAPRVYSAGIASVGEKSAGAQIFGIDPAREHATTNFDTRVSAGSPLAREAAAYQALLGLGLAKRLAASVGDELVILSQGADGSLANELYEVVGIMESGDPMTDQASIYLHIADAQELLVLGTRVHEIAIVSHSPKGLHDFASDIAAAIDSPALLVEPWQEFNKQFYEAMKMDQEGNWVSIFVIMLVVSVCVLNTVLMSVLERTREYGLLKAMGTRPRQVFGMVVQEVFVLALLSIAAGIIAALGVNYWLSIHGVSMPTALDFAGVQFKDMYAEINRRSYIIPGVTVLLSALIVGLFPALKAARTAPAVAMRAH